MVIRISNSWNTNNELKGSSKNRGLCKFFGGDKKTDEAEGQKTFAAGFAGINVSGETGAYFEGNPEDLEKFFKLCQQDNIMSWDLLKKMGKDFVSGLKSALADFNAGGESAFGGLCETIQKIVVKTKLGENKADLEMYKDQAEFGLKRKEIDLETRKAERELEKKFSKED